MALSANRTDLVISQDSLSGKITPEILDDAVLYYGALCSCDADTGACKPYDGTEADKMLGWHVEESITGDTSASPKPRASLITGPFYWHRCPVTGLAGTAADIGKRVWATDDGTYTVTDPGSVGTEVGVVVMYSTSSVADVWMRNILGQVDVYSVLPTPTPTPTPTP